MGTHPIFESDFDCLTETMASAVLEVPHNQPAPRLLPAVREVEPQVIDLVEQEGWAIDAESSMSKIFGMTISSENVSMESERVSCISNAVIRIESPNPYIGLHEHEVRLVVLRMLERHQRSTMQSMTVDQLLNGNQRAAISDFANRVLRRAAEDIAGYAPLMTLTIDSYIDHWFLH